MNKEFKDNVSSTESTQTLQNDPITEFLSESTVPQSESTIPQSKL